MEDTLEDVRARLADLSALSARQAADDDAIVTAAIERIRQIDGELDDLMPKVASDDAASVQYQALIKERGTLQQTLARLGR